MIFKSNNTQLNFANATAFLTYPSISRIKGVRHAFSTRIGGISRDCCKAMNLSFGRDDDDETVRENYKIFCKATGFDYNTLVSSDQCHNTVVRAVTKDDIGEGIYKKQGMEGVDALITDRKGVTLVTHYADCTPIFLIEPNVPCIGLVHSGWRGTVKEICRETIEQMRKRYGADPKKMIAAVGPAIGFCCFEVDKPVADEFAAMTHLDTEKFIKDDKNGKYHIDLLECNRQILASCGIPDENITVSDICTKCNHDLLFSHRATQGKRGGMVAMMCLE